MPRHGASEDFTATKNSTPPKPRWSALAP